jgi:hypothetical protein
MPLEAWISACIYSVFVLSCAEEEALLLPRSPTDCQQDRETEEANDQKWAVEILLPRIVIIII